MSEREPFSSAHGRTIDRLVEAGAEIAALRLQVSEQAKELADLRREVAERDELIEKLEDRIQELEWDAMGEDL